MFLHLERSLNAYFIIKSPKLLSLSPQYQPQSTKPLPAGFEPWDVSMSDLLAGRASLSDFRGVIFVGGFSYGDVLDSAKGWAGAIRFNPALWQQFQAFYERKDTFSLGVCNGCQLMALLGWVRNWPHVVTHL